MVEIISFHIPKTGGSSFYEILKVVYGQQHIKRYTRTICKNLQQQGLSIRQDLDPDTKIIQGHFYYHEVQEIAKEFHPKIILWLRDPVERVISNYYWWHHRVQTNPHHPETHRKGEPLEIYITRPETQNKIHRFLDGFKFKQLFFLGFLENFDKDIESLARKLSWQHVPYFHEKDGKKYSKDKMIVSQQTRKLIAKLNKKDVALFKKARKWKRKFEL